MPSLSIYYPCCSSNCKLQKHNFFYGLDETLTYCNRGTPWHLTINEFGGTAKTLAFTNFNEDLVVRNVFPADGKVMGLTVDYSKKNISLDLIYQYQLVQQLAIIRFFLQ